MFDIAKAGKSLFDILKIFAIKSPGIGLTINDSKVEIVTSGKQLFEINDEGTFKMPLAIEERLRTRLSKLPDDLIDIQYTETLIGNLIKNTAMLRLNHLGFCYCSSRRAEEIINIVNTIKTSGWNLYEEEANEAAMWLYVGNITDIDSPLLEIMPMPDISMHDKWLDYYLPHIQIDIDTGLASENLKEILAESFSPLRKPLRMTVIDGITYSWRIRLGAISGVNIDIDLGTNSRNREYRNKYLLKKII